MLPQSTSVDSAVDAATDLVLNLSSNPTSDQLHRGGVIVSLINLPASPVILGKPVGGFAILQYGTVQVHVIFAGFVAALDNRLSAGATVAGFYAKGWFDSTSNTLTANKIAVALH